jgi:hypothetical protein
MSNRAQRRSDTRAFRHQVHRDFVLTHLIDVNADLSASNFSDSARPGAYLFATPPGAADIASVSVLCVECPSFRSAHDRGPSARPKAARRYVRQVSVAAMLLIDHVAMHQTCRGTISCGKVLLRGAG